ncbi:MAG: transglycosylase [Ruminococcaceae bacterium]|nr:transglycosylase [Oscillospiraceae bacterium]
MDDNRAEPRRSTTGSVPSRRKRKKRVTFGGILLGILKVFFTLMVIGLLTAGLFYRTFMHYVNTVLEPEMDIDASAYVLKQSSVIYYEDKVHGQWVELQKIHGSENRTLVDYDQIPDHVVKALISIEDQRFYEHNGVDWRSTARSVVDTLTGNNARGASTITQQLIKNLTGEKQVTIRRKILEIFRALRFHEKYSEKEILEMYLNLVYFGHNAYGISAAAETYFGKDVSELTVAEGAAIVGITQNPWQYDALRSEWARSKNRERQLNVLYKMNEQGWLSDREYELAKAEKMVFVGDADYVEEETEEETAEAATAKNELDSFFVEQLFRDVVEALMDKGYSRQAAQDLLYTGGYQIYCTLDPEIQEIIERVYADQNNFNYKSDKGEMLQSGMTIIDNRTHNIVAIAGRVGERNGALEWSYAASKSPCGSAIKPLSVYAPALDAGIITAASVIDDYPVFKLNDSAWPTNAYSGYRGLLTIQDALRISSNTTAVRVLEELTAAESYTFLTDKLGIELAPEDLSSDGALALGGLTYGVSTIEMAAAYSMFANNGIYTAPRTFVEVRDRYGNVVIDSKRDTCVALKESTVYTINELLKNVVRDGGTGAEAELSGMTMAGKTGTTSSRRDRYFVGYTPYYTAACWCGYPTPSRIDTNDNPAVYAWKKVMSQVHEGLEDAAFPTTSDGMVSVTVCNKTGLLAGSGCGETRTVMVPQGLAPVYTCDAHVGVPFCKESDLPAGEFCPEDQIEMRWFVDLTAPNTAAGFGYTREPFWRSVSDWQYEIYAAQVEAGLRESIPSGVPLEANDTWRMKESLEYLGPCIFHLTPQETVDPLNPIEPGGEIDPNNPNPTDPTVTPDPGNPVDWFENPLGPLMPIDPNNPGGTTEPGGTAQGGEGEDNSNAEFLDDYLHLNQP